MIPCWAFRKSLFDQILHSGPEMVHFWLSIIYMLCFIERDVCCTPRVDKVPPSFNEVPSPTSDYLVFSVSLEYADIEHLNDSFLL